MPKQDLFNPYTEQDALGEAVKIKEKVELGEAKDYQEAEKMIESEELDEESYQKFFELKTNFPIADPDYSKKKETDPSVKRYIVKDGTIPALIHKKWDHDTDLMSLENVIRYCYENKIYGKTLDGAINLIISKKPIALGGRWSVDYADSSIIEYTQDEDEIGNTELGHILGHINGGIYDTGRVDLVRKLNESYIERALKFKHYAAGTSAPATGFYHDSIIKLIENTGKNPFPFAMSGFDNEDFLRLLKDYKKYRPDAHEYEIEGANEYYEELMRIKYFDETGELIEKEKIEEPTEIVEGVYVDVDGTLVVGENQLNQKLVEKLYEYKNQGKKVVIFTAGNVTEQAKRLRKLGLSVTDPSPEIPYKASDEEEERIKRESMGDFEVASKGNYLGKKLETTIDDFSQDQLKNILGIFSKGHQQV